LQLATGPDNPLARTLPKRIVNNLPSIPFWFGTILFLFGGVMFLAGCGQGSSPMIIIGGLMCIISLLLTVNDRHPENVRVHAVIISELELGDIDGAVQFSC
jgi:drug/metabolite transporter (DMT)-like permease